MTRTPQMASVVCPPVAPNGLFPPAIFPGEWVLPPLLPLPPPVPPPVGPGVGPVGPGVGPVGPVGGPVGPVGPVSPPPLVVGDFPPLEGAFCYIWNYLCSPLRIVVKGDQHLADCTYLAPAAASGFGGPEFAIWFDNNCGKHV
jgi:hypothetical protein